MQDKMVRHCSRAMCQGSNFGHQVGLPDESVEERGGEFEMVKPRRVHSGTQVGALRSSVLLKIANKLFRVDSLGVRDDSEIDWKRLPDPDWNAWSAHVLQRRWLTLKRAVKGYEDMTHQGELQTPSRVPSPVSHPPPILQKSWTSFEPNSPSFLPVHPKASAKSSVH